MCCFVQNYHLSVTFHVIQMVLETSMVTNMAIQYFIEFWLFIYLLISTRSCGDIRFYASITYYPVLTTVSMETPSTPALSQLSVLICYQEINIYQYRITGRGDKDKFSGVQGKAELCFVSQQWVTNLCFRISTSGFCQIDK